MPDILLLPGVALALVGFAAYVGYLAAREMAPYARADEPRGTIRDAWAAVIIVTSCTACLMPQVLLLAAIPSTSLAIGLTAILGVMPVALLCGRMLSESYFRPAPVGRGPLYHWIGVRAFKRIVPGGEITQRLERRAGQGQAVLLADRRELAVLEHRGRAAERAHAISLVAAIPAIVIALWFDRLVITAMLVVANIVLHLYPVLVQRQTRSRVLRLSARMNATARPVC